MLVNVEPLYVCETFKRLSINDTLIIKKISYLRNNTFLEELEKYF